MLSLVALWTSVHYQLVVNTEDTGLRGKGPVKSVQKRTLNCRRKTCYHPFMNQANQATNRGRTFLDCRSLCGFLIATAALSVTS